MKKYGVMIVGTGWVSGEHIRAFEMNEHSQVVAIVSRSYERGRAKADVLQIISELIRQRQLITVQQCLSQKSERLKQIIEYIRKNYSTQLTIAAMADEFHMSEKYFSRYFRNATGQNFTAYLNTIRIKQACTLLRETDRTVLEIAFECGYENVSYFNRVFRSQMGISPLQYRNTSDYIQ